MRLKRTITLFIFLLATSITFSQTFEIYISDAGNFNAPPWQILKFDENGENPELFTDENVVWPQDILFLEDQGVVLISNLTTSGIISKYNSSTGEFIENFATGIGGPTRMKIGADSLLYVLQWGGNGKVLRYKQDGTFVDEFTSEGVTNSIGIAWDSAGNLYVSSYSGDKVQKFDPDGNDLGAFISTNLVGPTNIWFNESGELIVLDYDGGAIKKFDADGNFIETIVSGLSGPEGIAFFSNGNFIIGNGGTGSIKLYDADGNYIEDFIISGTAGLLTPNAIVIREVTTVSVSEPEPEPEPEVVANYIKPSIGTEFFLNAETSQDIRSVEVYNTAGMLVQKGAIKGDRIWDASTHADGLYVISLTSVDGFVFTQKVMVKK